jgi:Protein of unknown function (DUF2934)
MTDNPTGKRVTSITEHSSSSPDLDEKIRIRAYELYEQRGRVDGHADEHWLQAESEVRGGKRQSAVA